MVLEFFRIAENQAYGYPYMSKNGSKISLDCPF
jgi:hypothetical protein